MEVILHITAHLGGGVGKCLSGLVTEASRSDAPFKHVIATLEEQEKTQFIDIARASGCEVVVCPTRDELNSLVEKASVVQLEWWNHPLTIKTLCVNDLPPMRLLAWSHVSGLYTPTIPQGLIRAADAFLFTSPCTYEAPEVAGLPEGEKAKLGVVSSSGGFDGFPPPTEAFYEKLGCGYIGSLNFAKLHPDYVKFASAVDLPDFSISFIGDTTNGDILQRQCAEAGKPGLIDLKGYTTDVVSALSKINALVYLLNPEHYGTTENALIEAMSMGIVPIVLGNPCERNIVTHNETGLIVETPADLAAAMKLLAGSRSERARLGMAAAASVRTRFTSQKMEATLNLHYAKVLGTVKHKVDFGNIFGATPAEWFLSCQRHRAIFEDQAARIDPTAFGTHGLYESSKGTVFHFAKYFKDDRISQWAEMLKSAR